MIISVPKNARGKQRGEKGGVATEEQSERYLGFEVEERATSQGTQVPLEAGKGEEMDSTAASRKAVCYGHSRQLVQTDTRKPEILHFGILHLLQC